MGLHCLSAREASEHIGLSQQALSELQSGKRDSPRSSTVRKLGDFFGVPRWKLEDTPFEQLLTEEIADPERFRQVEAKIHRSSARKTRHASSRRQSGS
jgi:transcriptional regulator with XRE-family HTH domain